MRKIYNPIKNQDGSWRTDDKTDLLIKHADIVRYIKAHRIRWIAHIVRMDKERPVNRITRRRPTAVRKIGRLRLGWEDDVREDMGKMKTQNWCKMTMDRAASKRNAEQAKLLKNYSAQRRSNGTRGHIMLKLLIPYNQ